MSTKPNRETQEGQMLGRSEAGPSGTHTVSNLRVTIGMQGSYRVHTKHRQTHA